VLKFRWNDELDAALIEFRRRGLTYEACAEKLGVDKDVLGRRAQELGVNRRLNRNRIRGTIAQKRFGDALAAHP
jgi:hypothetical protein